VGLSGRERGWASPGRVMIVGLGCAAVLLVVSSCGVATPPPTSSRSVLPVGINDPIVTTLPSAVADPIQAEVLADGSVTHSEMERVLLAVAACVREEGYFAEMSNFVHGEGWSFEISGGDSSEETDRAEERFNTCSAQLMSSVEPAYWTEWAPTQQEVLAREQEVLGCLSDNGFDVEGMTRVGEFLSQVSIDEGFEALERCEYASSGGG